MNKKKKEGFTLIELLAVITIIGILMMAAVPAVSKMIVNARKSTFAETASKILSNTRNKYTTDSIICYTSPTTTIPISGIESGKTVYIPFGMDDITTHNTSIDKLLEEGVTSPFGNAKLSGYIEIKKQATAATYKVALVDENNHGLKLNSDCALEEENLKKENVKVDSSSLDICKKNSIENYATATGKTLCTIK